MERLGTSGNGGWCQGPESNRHARRRRIFFTLHLSMPECSVRALDYAFAVAFALGTRRLVSTRSPQGFARRRLGAWPGGSPNLTGFTRALSPPGAQIALKSAVYTNFTTLAWSGNNGIIPWIIRLVCFWPAIRMHGRQKMMQFREGLSRTEDVG